MPNHEPVSAGVIAKIYGKSLRTISTWRLRGCPTADRRGNIYYYHPHAVDAWVKRHVTPEPTSKTGAPASERRRRRVGDATSTTDIAPAVSSGVRRRGAAAAHGPAAAPASASSPAAEVPFAPKDSVAGVPVARTPESSSDEDDPVGPLDPDMDAAEADRRWRILRCRREQIEIAIIRGTYVNAEDVASALRRRVASAVQYFRSIPTTIAESICQQLGVSISEAPRVSDIISEHLDEVVARLSTADDGEIRDVPDGAESADDPEERDDAETQRERD